MVKGIDIKQFEKYIDQNISKEFKISNDKRKDINKKTKDINEHISTLFTQRDSQRKILFNYCLWAISILLGFMFIVLIFQIFYKLNTGDNLISPSIYNTVFVSVIIQFIGIVFIIANKLWDEKGIESSYNSINY